MWPGDDVGDERVNLPVAQVARRLTTYYIVTRAIIFHWLPAMDKTPNLNAAPSDGNVKPLRIRYPPVDAACVQVLACTPDEPVEFIVRIFVDKYSGNRARPAVELRRELCEMAGSAGANALIHIEDHTNCIFASAIRMSQSISIDAGSSISSFTRTR